jgi:hypothetical protein
MANNTYTFEYILNTGTVLEITYCIQEEEVPNSSRIAYIPEVLDFFVTYLAPDDTFILDKEMQDRIETACFEHYEQEEKTNTSIFNEYLYEQSLLKGE